jgi:hypothetical protein
MIPKSGHRFSEKINGGNSHFGSFTDLSFEFVLWHRRSLAGTVSKVFVNTLSAQSCRNWVVRRQRLA